MLFQFQLGGRQLGLHISALARLAPAGGAPLRGRALSLAGRCCRALCMQRPPHQHREVRMSACASHRARMRRKAQITQQAAVAFMSCIRPAVHAHYCLGPHLPLLQSQPWRRCSEQEGCWALSVWDQLRASHQSWSCADLLCCPLSCSLQRRQAPATHPAQSELCYPFKVTHIQRTEEPGIEDCSEEDADVRSRVPGL